MAPREILIVLSVLMLLIFRRWTMETLMEGIDNFMDSFRGGPPTAMHPSPSNDSALLRRRFRKTEN
jgi:hypothetical protein